MDETGSGILPSGVSGSGFNARLLMAYTFYLTTHLLRCRKLETTGD